LSDVLACSQKLTHSEILGDKMRLGSAAIGEYNLRISVVFLTVSQIITGSLGPEERL
jgi:hypothetical protein